MIKQIHIVAGKPGSGKTTAARSAAETNNFYHFSIGNELREIAFNGKESQFSDELANYREALAKHQPVPVAIAENVLEECIDKSSLDNIIIDGYPQYLDRLPGFQKILHNVGGKVLGVYNIDIDDNLAKKRLRARPNRSSNIPEDNEFINKRLDGWAQNGLPTLEKLGRYYPIMRIDGSLDRDSVRDQLVRAINNSVIHNR